MSRLIVFLASLLLLTSGAHSLSMKEDLTLRDFKSDLERILVPGLSQRQSAISLVEFNFLTELRARRGIDIVCHLNKFAEIRWHPDNTLIGKLVALNIRPDVPPLEAFTSAVTRGVPLSGTGGGLIEIAVPLSSSSAVIGAIWLRLQEDVLKDTVGFAKAYTLPKPPPPEQPPSYAGIELRIASTEPGRQGEHEVTITLTNDSKRTLSYPSPINLGWHAQIRLLSSQGEVLTRWKGTNSEFIPVYSPEPPPVPPRNFKPPPEIKIEPGSSKVFTIRVSDYLSTWPSPESRVGLSRLQSERLRLKVQWDMAIVSNEIEIGPP